MVSGENETDVAAIAVADHVDRAEPKLLDNRRSIFGHLNIGKGLRGVGAVAVAAAIDTDDLSKRRKVISLPCEIRVKEAKPTVQEDDGRASAECLNVELRAVHFMIAIRRRNASLWMSGHRCSSARRSEG